MWPKMAAAMNFSLKFSWVWLAFLWNIPVALTHTLLKCSSVWRNILLSKLYANELIYFKNLPWFLSENMCKLKKKKKTWKKLTYKDVWWAPHRRKMGSWGVLFLLRKKMFQPKSSLKWWFLSWNRKLNFENYIGLCIFKAYQVKNWHTLIKFFRDPED